MNRRTFCIPALVGILLWVCLGTGPAVQAAEGTPRPSYFTDFAPATRVELLEDAPSLGAGLKAGMSGIILCCDTVDCSGKILVSWNLWRGGRNEEATCKTALAGLYPTGSATWVDPTKVRLGVPFNAKGVIRTEGGCLYLAAEGGKYYRLMLSDEFKAKWWTVMPGAFMRIRGLLNTSPNTNTACDQKDGDIYHPIASPQSWSTERNSWDRGPFFNGDRVVLVGEENPFGATKLPRGATGTVICRNSMVARSVLVSWDLWDSRTEANADVNDYDTCLDRISGMYPPGSAWWVEPIDLARYYESNCGTLEQTLLCCGQNCTTGLVGLFVPFEDVYCLPDISTTASLPTGMVRAIGLYTPFEELMDPTAATPEDPALRTNGGIILDSLVVTCHVPNCCEAAYVPGDRVQLLVNEPGGATGLAIGRGGTVVCCNPDDPITPILVSWDSYMQIEGGYDTSLCATAPASFVPGSAVWMACSEIKRVTKPELRDEPAYRQFLPQTLAVGKHLRVQAKITNSGGGSGMSGSFVVTVYLSTDNKIDATDTVFGSMLYNMEPGAQALLSLLYPLPDSITTGKYYVGMLIDSGSKIAEEDETNNTVVFDGQLTVTAQ